MTTKYNLKNIAYIENFLGPIEQLDINKANYVSEKEKILLGTTIQEEINFKMFIDVDD